jgi:hypothetical protein
MMHHVGGPGWGITVDTNGMMLMALYFRDVAGMLGAGKPAVSPARPAVHAADPRQLTSHKGGPDALRAEWEYWWEQLVMEHPDARTDLSPPDFDAFSELPALQCLLQAHFGGALTWAKERRDEYLRLSQAREATGRNGLFGQLVEDREMELGRNARSFELSVIELPLSEPRAWYIEPNKVIMSQELVEEEQIFRSFFQPVVELLV